jgi:hypothetical protein
VGLTSLCSYREAYKKRVGEKVPNWESLAIQRVIFDAAGPHWHTSEHLVALLSAQLQDLKTVATKDQDGVLVLPKSHPAVSLFSSVLGYITSDAKAVDEVPLVREYVDLLIRSTLAMRVLSIWKRNLMQVPLFVFVFVLF